MFKKVAAQQDVWLKLTIIHWLEVVLARPIDQVDEEIQVWNLAAYYTFFSS